MQNKLYWKNLFSKQRASFESGASKNLDRTSPESRNFQNPDRTNLDIVRTRTVQIRT